eukprot:m.190698 g.190698  ORF g.190698 m.190698 type:complete len:79 (-) comp53630_c1_seq28:1384-1620(-)
MAHRDISTAPSRDDLGRQVSYTVLPPTVASDSIVVYKRRWWLLFVVCCLVFEQGGFYRRQPWIFVLAMLVIVQLFVLS